jgi:hypothetical protein
MKKADIATSFPVASSPVTGHGRDIGQWKTNTTKKKKKKKKK